MAKPSLKDRILALLESEADNETEETTEEAPAEQETLTLTEEQLNELIEAKIAEMSTSEAAPPEAPPAEQTPAPKAQRPAARTQPITTVLNLDKMTHAEIADAYNRKGGIKEQLDNGRETVVHTA